MKNFDDSTMSLFGDDLPPAKPTPPNEDKKPRAKRQVQLHISDTDATGAHVTTHAAPATVASPEVPVNTIPSQIKKRRTQAAAAETLTPTPPVLTPIPLLQTTPSSTPRPNGAHSLRRNTPWFRAASNETPHVMLVITRGEKGGAQSHVLSLCQSLHPQVQFSVVIGEHTDSALARDLRALGVRVLEMPALRESLMPWQIYRATQQLLELIAQEQPDVLHAHSAIAGMVSRLAARWSQTPVIYTVHGFAFKPQASWLRRKVSHWVEQNLIDLTDEMICVSQYERELALLLGMEDARIHTIANGIPASTHASPHHKLVTERIGVPRVIMVARMSAPKRPDLLLRAAQLLKEQLGYEIPITLVGGGPLLAQYQQLGNKLGLEDIQWLGDVQNVEPLLQSHDIFVLISDHEGMPMTVLEAMRAGKAIVASNLPGIQEQIMHSHEGLLTENTPQAIAHELLQLLRDPFLMQRLGQAARLHFEHAFNAERMAEKVMQVYEVTLQRHTQTAPTPTSALSSATVQRRNALHNWTLWGAWLLFPSLALSQILQSAGWVTYQFEDTLWWCIVPYIVASYLLQRASHLPVAERAGVLWVSTLTPFAFTPLGFALIQHPYSRAAVIWSYLLTTLWLWWGYRRHIARRALRLAYIDPLIPQRLQDMMLAHEVQAAHLHLIAWDIENKQPRPACDGVVLDEQAPHSTQRTARLGELKMQHLRLYSSSAVAELLSGRKILSSAQDTLWALDNDPQFDRIKRLLDVICVIILAPVWVTLCVLVALAVKLDSPGPVLFIQSRVGRNGQPFRLLKFRSMVHGLENSRVDFAQNNDPRITRLGKWIRRTRLDELPQLINVLIGQMSLIGPRPEQVHYVREFATTLPSYTFRHLVRPGLTGWAQVQQGYADSVDSTRLKLSYDLYYVEHYSLALDLLIAAKTVKTIFTGFGAR